MQFNPFGKLPVLFIDGKSRACAPGSRSRGLVAELLVWPTLFAQAPREPVHLDVIAKIKEEGQLRSKVMETVSYLTDVHGPRQPGSPITRRAGEWTKNRLTEWGLQNAHLESWGPFGRGWTLEEFKGQHGAAEFFAADRLSEAWVPQHAKGRSE